MGQLIHQYELGISLERSINIKFTKGHSFVRNLFHRKLLQAVQKCHRLGSGMGFYVSSNHIDATLLSLMSRLKHGIGLSDTCGITEKDFEFSAFLSGCIVTDRMKKLIRILSWQFHFNPPIKEIFRPEIIAKDAAMVITPIPAILLYTPLCALNYKSKGVKKVKENAYLY